MAKAILDRRPSEHWREYFGRGASLALVEVPGTEELSFDPALDSNQAPWAPAWLGTALWAELQALEAQISFRLSNGVLTVSQRASFVPKEQRARAVALARTIAGRGRALLAEWQAAAAALNGRLRAESELWSDDGKTSIEVDRLGVAIVIDGWRDPREMARLHTRLRCRRVSERVDLVIRSRSAESPAGLNGIIEVSDPRFERLFIVAGASSMPRG